MIVCFTLPCSFEHTDFCRQDFYNLLTVYLDAVFCPLLRELDFLQEGWRLENEELDDKNSPFIIKGT
jgi:Zn-dependent M16 (insulinase) family peptidase